MAEYHEQEEIFKLRLGHLKKVCEAYAGFFSLPEDVGSCVISFLLKKSKLKRESTQIKNFGPKKRGIKDAFLC